MVTRYPTLSSVNKVLQKDDVNIDDIMYGIYKDDGDEERKPVFKCRVTELTINKRGLRKIIATVKASQSSDICLGEELVFEFYNGYWEDEDYDSRLYWCKKKVINWKQTLEVK